MADAMINGQRKTSADAEFRRCVKNNLQYRGRWDNKFDVADRTQRAKDGCSRWHPGRHFVPWAYGTPGVLDPGKYANLITEEGGIGKTKLSKSYYVGIICDDIEDSP
eukprot:1737311-Heterocapsa_arctica.AAC.1